MMFAIGNVRSTTARMLRVAVLLAYVAGVVGIPMENGIAGTAGTPCQCRHDSATASCCCSHKKLAAPVKKSCCAAKKAASAKQMVDLALRKPACEKRPASDRQHNHSGLTVSACSCGTAPVHGMLVQSDPHLVVDVIAAFNPVDGDDWVQATEPSAPSANFSPDTPPPKPSWS